MARPDETIDETGGLTGPQLAALEALLAGMTTPEAAKAAGVGRNTVWRWQQDPTFAKALRDAEAVQLGEVARALGAAGSGAVATLVLLKDDAELPAAVRVRAASELLGKLMPLRELVTLETRIAALEAALDREGT
jgi:hypothetical protein